MAHLKPLHLTYTRWLPPHYRESVQAVPAESSPGDWISFNLSGCPQRCFLWMPWSVMLRYRYGFGEPWYEPDLPWRADVVSMSRLGDALVVTDMFVDVSMSEDGTRYKVLDLDELVQATVLGKVSEDGCLEALRILQRWLDMLHGFRVTKDFPPESLPSSAS